MDKLRCKTCGKEILFIQTKSGKHMPVEPVPVGYHANPLGKSWVINRSGEMIRCDLTENEPDGFEYLPHFAKCPGVPGVKNYKEFRRPEPQKEPEPKKEPKKVRTEYPQVEQMSLFSSRRYHPD